MVVHWVLRAFLVLFSHLLHDPLPGVGDSWVHGLPGHVEGAEAGEGVAVDDEAGGGGPHLDTGQVPATALAAPSPGGRGTSAWPAGAGSRAGSAAGSAASPTHFLEHKELTARELRGATHVGLGSVRPTKSWQSWESCTTSHLHRMWQKSQEQRVTGVHL